MMKRSMQTLLTVKEYLQRSPLTPIQGVKEKDLVLGSVHRVYVNTLGFRWIEIVEANEVQGIVGRFTSVMSNQEIEVKLDHIMNPINQDINCLMR